MQNLADFKRVLKCNPTFEMTRHRLKLDENKEVISEDQTPVIRTVNKVQSNAVCFNALQPDGTPFQSWLEYPKAIDCKFPDRYTLEIYGDKYNGIKYKTLTYKLQSSKSEPNKIETPKTVKAPDIRHWMHVTFQSSSEKTDQFSSFAKQIKKYLTAHSPDNTELIYNIGHFYVSGFLHKKYDNGGYKTLYFNIGDVRFNGSPLNMYFREARHTKDYTGGRNQSTDLLKFPEDIKTFFETMQSEF